MKEKNKNRVQMSESFMLSGLLAVSGGFQDAYTYNVRDHVFSNAQTGNIVLLSQHLMSGEWKVALRYLIPLIAFAGGVLVAEQISTRYRESFNIHWRQIIVLLELIILCVVGFIPTQLNLIATMLVSFSCAMQVQAFRKVKGFGYASTMCIGNLRSGTENLSIYLREHTSTHLNKAMHYYGIILLFALGAGIGGIFSIYMGIPAIWGSSVLLFLAFLAMGKEYL